MDDSLDTLLIGVDGGGTGCRVAVGTAREGVLAIEAGGRANASTGLTLAIANISETIAAATRKAGRNPQDLSGAVAHLGLAGVMTQLDADRVAQALPYAHCEVTDDRPTVVVGALDGADGFLVSVGTGTIIAASHTQQFRFVGGWGFHLSDQASGAWLGHNALRRAMLCHDGMHADTELTRRILARFDGDPNAIVTFSMTARPGEYGSLAPLVVEAARQGDALGLDLMREGADYIARGLTVLGFQEGDALCLTGGVGQHYGAFLDQTLTRRLVTPRRSAVEGAFHMAGLAARNRHGVST